MDVERAVLPLQLHAPHAIHQRCACEDDALIFQQQAQQFEFLVRQCDVCVVHLHDALRRTDTQRPGAVFARRGGACPPEHGPDARRKLQHTERLRDEIIRTAVEAALAEDAPYGDITCETTIPADETGSAHLTARERGVMSGIAVFTAAFMAQNPGIGVSPLIADGERFQRGQILATVEGPVRDLLAAERIALNFTQRMSGIATMTASFVDAVNAIYDDGHDGTVTRPHRYERTRIVDTRKTTPGLRPFEKYAVVCGGGHNHRYGLSDAVMMKDNHLAALAARGIDLTGAIRHVREQVGHTTHIEVEVDRLDQIPAVLAGGADTIMLDNFSLDDTRRGVELIDGKAIVEASGNMSLERVPAVAVTGVDVISVGALTHSVRSIDLGLDWN